MHGFELPRSKLIDYATAAIKKNSICFTYILTLQKNDYLLKIARALFPTMLLHFLNILTLITDNYT